MLSIYSISSAGRAFLKCSLYINTKSFNFTLLGNIVIYHIVLSTVMLIIRFFKRIIPVLLAPRDFYDLDFIIKILVLLL